MATPVVRHDFGSNLLRILQDLLEDVLDSAIELQVFRLAPALSGSLAGCCHELRPSFPRLDTSE
jgi:hypothetical protein